MIPLTITAHLQTPVVPKGPLLLDGILYAGLGRMRGLAHPSGWTSPAEVFQEPLPLARVETSVGWWWAASQATPTGPEALTHAHRRAPLQAAERWTKARSVNVVAGPDKSLRIPIYSRPEWRVIAWSCVGDLQAIRLLLAHIPSVGQRTSQGWGWVDHWRVQEGGSPLAAYSADLSLRHLPVHLPGLSLPLGHLARRAIPLRPPYYSAETVPCWQVQP